MKQQHITLSALLSLLLAQSFLHADDALTLEKAHVETEVIEESGIGAKAVVNAKEIEIKSSAELLNPYKTISLEAGVDVRTNDPFGMDITHKIRGKADRNIGETLEGLPLKGIGPGGGLATMMDIENVSSVSVEKGASKPTAVLGTEATTGWSI